MSLWMHLAAAAAAASSSSEATVALLLQLTGETGLIGGAAAVACAAVLAVADANNRDGTVVPQFADMPADMFPIRALAYDTQSSRFGGIMAYRNASALGASVMVGPGRSVVSTPLAELGAVDRIPTISYWASSPILSDQITYPFFSRSYPSDDAPAKAMVKYVAHYNWRHISILHVRNDNWATGLRDGLAKEALEQGISIQRTASFDANSGESIREAVAAVADGDDAPNVVVGIFHDISLEAVVNASHEEGLLSHSHTWLLPETVSLAMTDGRVIAQAQQPALLAARVRGFMSATPVSGSEAAGSARLRAHWASQAASACANPLFDAPSTIFDVPPSELAYFSYDATAMAVLALADAATSGAEVTDAVRRVSFEGATGAVQLLAGTGDRDPRNLSIGVLNWQSDGEGGIVGVMAGAVSLGDGAAYERIADVEWMGGRREPPVDKLAEAKRRAARESRRNEKVALGAIVVAVAIGPLGLAYLLRKAAQRHRRLATIVRDYEAGLERKLHDALATTQTMKFPAALVAMRDFVALGGLQPHEALRDRGLLHFHDVLEDVYAEWSRIIFISHQWTSSVAPDPTNAQYQTMVAALQRIVDSNGWDADDTFVWCDYSSIPQRSRQTQSLAIASLSTYAALAHAFVIVAPPLTHETTQQPCDVHTYNRRMWCRAENLCHSLRNGVEAMWLATGTGADEISHLADDHGDARAFLESNLRVMHGECSVHEDKAMLVLPILGLYAQVYARHAARAVAAGRRGTVSRGDLRAVRVVRAEAEVAAAAAAIEVEMQATAGPADADADAADDANANAQVDRSSLAELSLHHPKGALDILCMIEANKSEIFPTRLTLSRSPPPSARSTRPGRAETGDAAEKPRAASLELFGPLVQMMETRIDTDDALRERLNKQEDERVAARKAALAARKVSLKSGWIARHSRSHARLTK